MNQRISAVRRVVIAPRTVRRASLLAVLVALCASLLQLAASPAMAASWSVINDGGIGVRARSEPRIADNDGYGVPTRALVTATCWTRGDAVGPNGNTIWWWIVSPKPMYISDYYVSSPYVATSTPSEPRCGSSTSTTRESRAVDWARSQLGVVRTSETTDGMWSGWCELFVERAYGTRGRYVSALSDYNAQRSAGRIHTDTNPPAGALVFYSWGSYGHVGISVGGGQVISTQGYNVPLPVRQHSVTGLGLPYLGWAYAPTSWPGR